MKIISIFAFVMSVEQLSVQAYQMKAEITYPDNEIKNFDVSRGLTKLPLKIKKWECQTGEPENSKKLFLTSLACTTRDSAMSSPIACSLSNVGEKYIFIFLDGKQQTMVVFQCLE